MRLRVASVIVNRTKVVEPADGDHPSGQTVWAGHGMRCKALLQPGVRRLGRESEQTFLYHLVKEFVNFMGA